MCLLDRQPLNRRSRVLLVLGAFCLCLGVLTQNLALHLAPNLTDFVRGFFIGLSLTFNLGAVLLGVRARREYPR